jgi:primosomal protein N'
VESVCRAAFETLKQASAKASGVAFLSCTSGDPVRLRGNYYWQILARANRGQALSKFLKLHLKKISSSGIIVTVDIDPL